MTTETPAPAAPAEPPAVSASELVPPDPAQAELASRRAYVARTNPAALAAFDAHVATLTGNAPVVPPVAPDPAKPKEGDGKPKEGTRNSDGTFKAATPPLAPPAPPAPPTLKPDPFAGTSLGAASDVKQFGPAPVEGGQALHSMGFPPTIGRTLVETLNEAQRKFTALTPAQQAIWRTEQRLIASTLLERQGLTFEKGLELMKSQLAGRGGSTLQRYADAVDDARVVLLLVGQAQRLVRRAA